MQPQKQTYSNFLGEIKQRIVSAQYEAMKAVNHQRMQLYWDIGKMIVEKQEQLAWGKSVVEQLAKDLQAEYPGQRGWSSRNLWRMRQLYLSCRSNEILTRSVSEFHLKCKNGFEREFYIRMTRKYAWTKNVLINNKID